MSFVSLKTHFLEKISTNNTKPTKINSYEKTEITSEN